MNEGIYAVCPDYLIRLVCFSVKKYLAKFRFLQCVFGFQVQFHLFRSMESLLRCQ